MNSECFTASSILQSTPHSILIESLLEILIKFYEEDPTKQENLFYGNKSRKLFSFLLKCFFLK